MAPRSLDSRTADVQALLRRPNLDAWVATASPDDGEHLVPLSVAWVDERLVVATPADTATGRNLAASGRARLGMGETRDVVMVEVELEARFPVADVPAAVAEGFAAQADWDPREGSGSSRSSYFVLRPIRVQAWREVDEIAGRTVMRDGRWSAPQS